MAVAEGEDDGSIIDLMVVYTPAARIAEGGTPAIEALINLAVEETNIAFANSQIAPRLRLVHTAEVNYTESGNMGTDLSRFRGKTDGYMDDVHAWRDAYAADQISLIESTGNYCGIAYLMSNVGSYFESAAFAVVHRSCATGYYSFGHERGHNLGSHHDRANAGSSPAYAYSYGLQEPNGPFRTVLSYNNCGCTRIQHYSNPDVLYGGLPTGIDHDISPESSADNARSIDNVAYTVANFRFSGSGPTEPPASPSNLSATPMSHTRIDLAWDDNSNNESGFELERSLDAASWQLVATLGANSIGYADPDLDPSTTYHYRLRSFNSLGGSSYTSGAQATTQDPPPYLEAVATSDIPVAGTVSSTFLNTQSKDLSYQVIKERRSGGKPQNRHSYLTHKWTFNLSEGNVVTFAVNGYMDQSADEDTFLFAYSTDNVTYTDMLPLTKTSADEYYQYYGLPNSIQGQVYVRVQDSDQTAGHQTLDKIYIDHMYISSEIAQGNPPAPPTDLTAADVAATRVDLTWTDNSEDESGFEIVRSLDGTAWSPIGSAGAGSTAYSDGGVSANTQYYYRVRAFNPSGSSAYTGAFIVNTPDGISLSATGYKVKGVQHVDLSWGGIGTGVDIYRDGSPIELNVAGGLYTDNIGNRGGGSYEYLVCDASLPDDCSNIVNVVF